MPKNHFEGPFPTPPAENPHETTIFAAELSEDTPSLDLHGDTVDEALRKLNDWP